MNIQVNQKKLKENSKWFCQTGTRLLVFNQRPSSFPLFSKGHICQLVIMSTSCSQTCLGQHGEYFIAENPCFFKSSSKQQLDVCTYFPGLSMSDIDNIKIASK